MHGHDFLLLASGEGIYDDTVLSQVNPNNPTRRDVVTMPTSATNVTGGYILIAFQLTNPGVWVIQLFSAPDFIAVALSYCISHFNGIRDPIR
jgi:Multicopper oxidase